MNAFQRPAALRLLDASLASLTRHTDASRTFSSICRQCRNRQKLQSYDHERRSVRPTLPRRSFTSTRFVKQIEQRPDAVESKNDNSSEKLPEGEQISIPTSIAESLPSTTENQRWQASKKLSRLMDDLLARASIAGQHINEYTGTDYTGIDTLRKEIEKQEQVVKSCIADATAAKTQHHEAHFGQAAAQREIVGLLERKASWSPTDLERYMALVRSEHVNEQAVQSAKDNLQTMERNLDEARALLERLERKRYHEEQVWSDTIRRNSTWVTFGLMGVNIVLLLAQITVFEPYRRKKIVRDVKAALDEKTISTSLADVAVAPAPQEADVEEEKTENVIDAFLPPATTIDADSPSVSDVSVLESAIATSEDRSNVQEPAEKVPKVETPLQAPEPGHQRIIRELRDRAFVVKETVRDQFSEREIQLRKVDASIAVLLSAALGALVPTIAFIAMRKT